MHTIPSTSLCMTQCSLLLGDLGATGEAANKPKGEDGLRETREFSLHILDELKKRPARLREFHAICQSEDVDRWAKLMVD